MKAYHEDRSTALTEEEVDIGVRVFANQAVRSDNQSGGITAHTIHQTFNVQSPLSDPAQEEQRQAEKLRRQSEARRYLAPS